MSVAKGDAHLRITAMPGRHGPPLADLVLPDVMGSPPGVSGVSGDAPLPFVHYWGHPRHRRFAGDPRRYPQIDLALLHLGGTRVLGILVTMDGKQGVQLMRIVAPQHAIPIHYNDYDVFTSPLADFQQEVQAAGLEERVHYLRHGDTYTFTVGVDTRGADGPVTLTWPGRLWGLRVAVTPDMECL